MADKRIYQTYAVLNTRLARGESFFVSASAAGCRFDCRPRKNSRRLKLPAIGIYAGQGASHSWLWFVELFDRMEFHDVVFLDEAGLLAGNLDAVNVLAVSGGDTFAVARGLGPEGARRIRDFIAGGGLYIGSCAGAYLPMNSSKPHLSDFNFAPVKITNLSSLLPDCRRNAHKFATAYGCDFVFHPVRETVRLKDQDTTPFGGCRSFDAPLYGGPGMVSFEPAQTLALYERFTAKTQFLVSEALAEKTLLGTAAAVRVPLGAGMMYLFGPHFEHPDYAEANRRLAEAIYWDGNRRCAKPFRQHPHAAQLPAVEARRLVHEVKRELSNARIAAAGIEMAPVYWLIGAKYYEPQKIRVFLESMWRRLGRIERLSGFRSTAADGDVLIALAEETTRLLRRMKARLDRKQDTGLIAERLFVCLNRYARVFFQLYFQSISPPTSKPRSQHCTPLPVAADSKQPPG